MIYRKTNSDIQKNKFYMLALIDNVKVKTMKQQSIFLTLLLKNVLSKISVC